MSIDSDTQALYVMNFGENVLPKKIGLFKQKHHKKTKTNLDNKHDTYPNIAFD